MTKTVLLIHSKYPLGTNAGDKIRTLNMAVSLKRLGYNVIFLGFYTRRIGDKRKELSGFPEGIKPHFFYTLPNRLHLHRLAAWYRAAVTKRICQKYSVDFIQAETTSAATCAKFVPSIPLVVDFHADFVPEIEMGGYAKYLVRYAAEENRFALARAAATITVSENLRNNLAAYAQSIVPNYILPCNISTEPFASLIPDTRQALRKRYGLEGKTVLCYSGGLHIWQCIAETIDTVIRLRKRNHDYFFCLYTNDDITPYKKQLQQLDGAYMVKSLKQSEMPAYLSMTDAGFVLRANSLVNINASPTKTAEYLAAGMMLIGTTYAGDAPQMIKESGCGMTIANPQLSDAEIGELDNALARFMENRHENAAKARNYVFEYRTWESNERKLAEIYQRIV